MDYLNQTLYFVDIETTGPSYQKDRVLEIAIIKTKGLQVIDRFHRLVNPKRPIPYFIQKFTGIGPDMVVNEGCFATLANDLNEFLDDGVFVAHNVSFDYNFLKNSLKREGYDLEMPKLCTVRLSRKMYPEFRKHNLDSVIERIGTKIQNRHRALDDCLVLVDFVEHLHNKFCNVSLNREIRNLTN